MKTIDRLTWGVDGYGRCSLCYSTENEVLFCGLDGVGGVELICIYEEGQE